MKKLNTFIIAFCFAALTVASVSFATFEGGGGSSVSLVDYAKKTLENTFTKGQLIHKTDSTVAGERRGLEIKNNEAGSLCLGPSDTPSDTKSFCFTNSGGLGKLEGQLGTLYGTGSAASTGFAFDSLSNGRMSIAPSGVTSIGAATTTAANVTLTIGSNTEAAATFAVDATNDWTKHLPIAAPAASECDESDERGRMYYDGTSDVYRYCNGAGWSDLSPSLVLNQNNVDATVFSDVNFRIDIDASDAGI